MLNPKNCAKEWPTSASSRQSCLIFFGCVRLWRLRIRVMNDKLLACVLVGRLIWCTRYIFHRAGAAESVALPVTTFHWIGSRSKNAQETITFPIEQKVFLLYILSETILGTIILALQRWGQHLEPIKKNIRLLNIRWFEDVQTGLIHKRVYHHAACSFSKWEANRASINLTHTHPNLLFQGEIRMCGVATHLLQLLLDRSPSNSYCSRKSKPPTEPLSVSLHETWDIIFEIWAWFQMRFLTWTWW